MGSSAKHHAKRARTKKGSQSRKPRFDTSPKPASKRDTIATAKLQIEECSFVQWDVSGISAVASSRCDRLVVVARSDGNIELRRKDLIWAMSSVINMGRGDAQYTVSAICFSTCSRYVFVSRLDGSLFVFEVTREGLREHLRLEPGGGAIWDIAVSRKDDDEIKIAIACDDGCVRFIRPDPSYLESAKVDGALRPVLPSDSMHYIVKISEGTKARILSVAWAPASQFHEEDCVACGDANGGIRWLNPTNGSLYGRGKIASVRQNNAMIWTIVFSRGGADVVCGDSRGMATVWSSTTNTMSQELCVEGLNGALWSSTVVGEGTASETVFFGSAGGSIGGLQSSFGASGEQFWVPLRGCHLHSHDVRTMTSFRSGTILTGSHDARMCLFTLAEFVDRKKVQWVLPYHGSVGQNPVQVCREDRLIVSRRQKGVDIWSISEESQSPELKLRMNLKSFDSNITACGISSDSTLLAASSFDTFRLYQIWDRSSPTCATEFGRVQLISLNRKVESLLRGCIDLTFCGPMLVAITKSKQDVVFYENANFKVFRKGEIGSIGLSLEHLTCSGGNIAVSDSKGSVFYTHIDEAAPDRFEKVHWKNVRIEAEGQTRSVSQLCFSPSSSTLAMALTDFTVVVKRIGSGKDTEWNVSGKFPCVVSGLSFSENEKSLLVSGEKFCAVACAGKSSRKRRAGEEVQTAGFEPYVLPYRDSILTSCALDKSKMVLVRRRWELVQASLADVIPRKPFGT